MAVGCIVEFQGGTKEQYDRTREIVERGMPEDGMTGEMFAHVAGALDNGNWCVFNIWDTREGFLKFYEERVKPAIVEVGQTPPTPRFFEVHNMYLKEQNPQQELRRAA